MKLCDVGALNQDLARVRSFEARHASRHGGLSRPRLANQCQCLPAWNSEIDLAYGRDGNAFPPQTSSDILFRESFDLQQVLDCISLFRQVSRQISRQSYSPYLKQWTGRDGSGRNSSG